LREEQRSQPDCHAPGRGAAFIAWSRPPSSRPLAEVVVGRSSAGSAVTYNERMTDVSDRLPTLERELRGLFGSRLQSLVAYGVRDRPHGDAHAAHGGHVEAPLTSTLAIVESVTGDDLKACAARIASWHDAGLATPLLLTATEFERSLDAFPLEFGAILADHTVVAGTNPFEGLRVDPADIRRACEMQARSHLLHLREGFLETLGRADALAVLIVRSAAPFAALLTSLARLQGLSPDAAAAARHAERTLELAPGVVTDVVKLAHVTEISSADATRNFPAYLDAAERLVKYVDRWSAQ
jgi:hypothetical protein